MDNGEDLSSSAEWGLTPTMTTITAGTKKKKRRSAGAVFDVERAVPRFGRCRQRSSITAYPCCSQSPLPRLPGSPVLDHPTSCRLVISPQRIHIDCVPMNPSPGPSGHALPRSSTSTSFSSIPNRLRSSVPRYLGFDQRGDSRASGVSLSDGEDDDESDDSSSVVFPEDLEEAIALSHGGKFDNASGKFTYSTLSRRH